MAHLLLRALHGQVHRFTGVVDRFGSFPVGGEVIHTVCVRELQHARTEQSIQPAHWWFRLREPWTQASVQQGDTVLFTAKVQLCSKGWDEIALEPDGPVRRRHQVNGFGGRIRDLVVTHRVQRHSVVVSDLQEQVRMQALLLAEAEAQARRLEIHRDALLLDVRELQERLRLITTHSRILDPAATRSLPARRKRGTERLQRSSFFARESVHNGAELASLSR